MRSLLVTAALLWTIAEAAVPVIQHVFSDVSRTPRGAVRVPASGGSIGVVGRGFRNTAVAAVCRLHSAGPECGALEEPDWAQYMTRAISFDKPDPSNYSTPATIINDTHLTCATPPVVSAGFAGLQVSVGADQWSVPNAASCISMVAVFSAAISRRPYLQEMEGAVLVRIDASVVTKGMSVSALLHTSTPILLLDRKPVEGERQRLAFSLGSLPAIINTSVTITVHLPSSNATYQQSRAFVRHYQPGPVGSTSVVDFETGSVLVNGQSEIIAGVYVLAGNMLVGDDLLLPSDRLHQPGFLEKIERLARSGLTTLLVYNL